MKRALLYLMLEAVVTLAHALTFGFGIILIKTLKNL